MRVDLSREQELLRKSVAGVLRREASFARVREWCEARDLSAPAAMAVAQGWTGIGLEEDRGGQGGGIIELAVMAQEFGRTALPWDPLLGSLLALRALRGSDADAAADLAAAVAEGDRAAVLCLDGRRMPAPWPASILRGTRLSLRADHVPGGLVSDLILPVEDADGVRLWRVAAAEAGAQPRPLVDRTRALARVELDDVEATDLGAISAETFAGVAATAAILVAADALGAAETLLEMTVAYVKQREQFGTPVGSFQAVKHAAAMMLVEVEASRSALQYGAWAVDAGTDDAERWAAIAKIQACGSAPHVADRALFLHGAIAYTWDHDLQFCFKRTRSDEWLFGGPDAYRDRIADGLALRP